MLGGQECEGKEGKNGNRMKIAIADEGMVVLVMVAFPLPFISLVHSDSRPWTGGRTVYYGND